MPVGGLTPKPGCGRPNVAPQDELLQLPTAEAGLRARAWRRPFLQAGRRPCRRRSASGASRYARARELALVQKLRAGAGFAGPADLGRGDAHLDNPEFDDLALGEFVVRAKLAAAIGQVGDGDIGISVGPQREAAHVYRSPVGATDEGLAAHLDFPFSSARGLSRGRRADCTALAACPKSERFLVSPDLDFLNPLQPKPCFGGGRRGSKCVCKASKVTA